MREQKFGCGKEVVENILLFLKHSGMMPILAKFTTAAQIGVGENSAVFDPTQRHGSVRWCFADIEAAVAGQQYRIRAVELQAFLVKQKHRNPDLVLRRIPNLLDFSAG